jgi:hypothetical protein
VIAGLESYLAELKAEIQAVEERLNELRGSEAAERRRG